MCGPIVLKFLLNDPKDEFHQSTPLIFDFRSQTLRISFFANATFFCPKSCTAREVDFSGKIVILGVYNTWGRFAGVGATELDFCDGRSILTPKMASRAEIDFLLARDLRVAGFQADPWQTIFCRVL